MKDNRLRIFTLLKILRKKSDEEHHLKTPELLSLLSAEGIEVKDRKTIYEDLKTLSDYGFDIENDHGYYLEAAPFSLSEAKILTDALSELKDLDEKNRQAIENKIFAYLSENDEAFLKSQAPKLHGGEKYFLHRLEDVLQAIRTHQAILLNSEKKEAIIYPLYLYRDNGYYYLYYHYENHAKLYHLRFDHIPATRLLEKKDSLSISQETILKEISRSSQAFYSGQEENITLLATGEPLMRLKNDFPTGIVTKNGLNLTVSLNHIFFAKIAAYGDQVKIAEPAAAKAYTAYLRSILTRYGQ